MIAVKKAAFRTAVQGGVGGVKIEYKKLLVFGRTPYAGLEDGGLHLPEICLNLAVTIRELCSQLQPVEGGGTGTGGAAVFFKTASGSPGAPLYR